jgi:hypothetical protein
MICSCCWVPAEIGDPEIRKPPTTRIRSGCSLTIGVSYVPRCERCPDYCRGQFLLRVFAGSTNSSHLNAKYIARVPNAGRPGSSAHLNATTGTQTGGVHPRVENGALRFVGFGQFAPYALDIGSDHNAKYRIVGIGISHGDFLCFCCAA